MRINFYSLRNLRLILTNKKEYTVTMKQLLVCAFKNVYSQKKIYLNSILTFSVPSTFIILLLIETCIFNFTSYDIERIFFSNRSILTVVMNLQKSIIWNMYSNKRILRKNSMKTIQIKYLISNKLSILRKYLSFNAFTVLVFS